MYLLRMPSKFGTLKPLKLKGGSKDAVVVATNNFLKNIPQKWKSSRGETYFVLNWLFNRDTYVDFL